MSVYTKISEEEIISHLKKYLIGDLVSLFGIADGIENTNYSLTTTHGSYIFTIFENIDKNEINQYLLLMNDLHEQGLMCPKVEKTNDEKLFKIISDKPSAIIQKLEGKSLNQTNIHNCELVGNLLGEFHNYSDKFTTRINNTRNLEWREKSNKKLLNYISKHESDLITNAISIQTEFEEQKLPKGIIHADLFRDNILFDKGKISGMIDFYYSCYDFLIYDLAVTANDWCCNSNGEIIEEKANVLIKSYNLKRKITENEKVFWGHALVSAALRFYLSRLLDLHFPKIGEMTHIKDPKVFENILRDRINHKEKFKL